VAANSEGYYWAMIRIHYFTCHPEPGEGSNAACFRSKLN
jgi:hypothetical protein